MTSPLLAGLMEADLPIRILAAIGGGAVGALLSGFVLQLLVKFSFGQNVPPWIVWPVRLLGGVACGLLVWSLLGAGGGLGFGWGGGGSGTGKDGDGDGAKQKKDEKPKEKGKDTSIKDSTPPPPEATLRIEVLGDPDLKRIAGKKFDPKKRYRVPGRRALLTLDEAQKLIRERSEATPALSQLEVVLYKNSPARDKEQVTALVGYAEDLGGKDRKLVVSYTVHPDQDAPV
jgi:hypothetical protein